MRKDLVQAGIDVIEYRAEQGIYVIDGLSLVRAVFEITNPETIVNVRALKD